MPVIKSAIKKLRQDRKQEKLNDEFRKKLESAVAKAKKSKTAESVKNAISFVDKAVKINILHKNKGSRVKSSLSKLAKPAQQSTKKTEKKPSVSKKPSKKSPKAK